MGTKPNQFQPLQPTKICSKEEKESKKQKKEEGDKENSRKTKPILANSSTKLLSSTNTNLWRV